MKQRFTSLLRNKEALLPYLLMLMVLCVVRGTMVSKLGLYWDDWRIYTRGVEGGAPAIIKYLCAERLLMGVPHAVLFTLFGAEPLVWHTMNFLLEFSCAVLIYHILKRTLKQEQDTPLLVALLYLAYPMSLIRTHIMTVYINTSLMLSLLSLWLTLWASQEPRGRALKIGVAVVLIPTSLLMYEFGLGFELIRLLLLGVALWSSTNKKESTLKVLRAYCPYAVGLVVFGIIRLWVYPPIAAHFAGHLRDGMRVQEVSLPAQQALTSSLTYLLPSTWLNAIQQTGAHPQVPEFYRVSMWFGASCVCLCVFLYGYLHPAQPLPTVSRQHRWGLLGVAFALCCLLLLPLWLTKLQMLHLNDTHSRHGYFATIGASLFLVVLMQMGLECLHEAQARRIATYGGTCLFLWFGVAYNHLHTQYSVQEWRNTKDFWHQAIALMPNIEKGTLLLINGTYREYSALGSTRDRDIYEPAQLFYGFHYGEVYGAPLRRVRKYATDFLESTRVETDRPVEPIGPKIGTLDLKKMMVLQMQDGVLEAVRPHRTYPNAYTRHLQKFSEPFPLSNAPLPPKALRLRQKLLGKAGESWKPLYAEIQRYVTLGDWENAYRVTKRMEQRKLRVSLPRFGVLLWEAALRKQDHDLAQFVVKSFREMENPEMQQYLQILKTHGYGNPQDAGYNDLEKRLGRIVIVNPTNAPEAPSP